MDKWTDVIKFRYTYVYLNLIFYTNLKYMPNFKDREGIKIFGTIFA